MLFYTGANKSGAIQGNQNYSLGGWISSSQVPNDFLNNIFTDIDYTTLKNDLKPLRVIAFKNLTGASISTFKVYTNTPENSHTKFKIGIIAASIDASCNCPYFEQLPSELSTPVYVEMSECEGLDNALTLSSVIDNGFVGIFIQRILIPENNVDYKGKQKTCVDFNADFVAEQAYAQNHVVEPDDSTYTPDEDEIEIIISY